MEKIEKLFDLAAERGPESIRIFALRRIDEPKKSGDVLDEDAEALKRYFAPLEVSKTVEGRPQEKRIRVDLEKQNTGIRVYKEQEWKSGPKYRLDQAFGFLDLDDLGTEKEFDRTVVNVGDSRNGDYSNWSIIYGPKAAGFASSDISGGFFIGWSHVPWRINIVHKTLITNEFSCNP